MVFDKESGLVNVWVGLIKRGVFKLEQVPELYNLKEMVAEMIKE